MAQYEFLVAGLPDLILDEGKNIVPFRTFMAEVETVVEGAHLDIIYAMRLPIDNQNLVNVLDNKPDFDERGNYSREELVNAMRTYDVPEYMQVFLMAHKENKQLFHGLTPIDQLTRLFYDDMAESGNEFLRRWYEFDSDMRNVVTGINLRKNLSHIEAIATDRPAANLTIVGKGPVAEAVTKSSSPDFGLSAEHPWVEKILALGRGSLTDMEKGLDDIRWDMLNELTEFSYFDIETVAAFTHKLFIAERWLKLDPAAGRARLDKLIEEMMSSFEMPEGF
ncbi:MAG: DUF2764 domain-containing protein [Chitinispirillia bacterium]|nr:DUF2764 domain-containing protein [Chitinispirillia bacterium]MCL2269435.1 DUF2764 domain-containing protein [Chitinispirillia bacterium]